MTILEIFKDIISKLISISNKPMNNEFEFKNLDGGVLTNLKENLEPYKESENDSEIVYNVKLNKIIIKK